MGINSRDLASVLFCVMSWTAGRTKPLVDVFRKWVDGFSIGFQWSVNLKRVLRLVANIAKIAVIVAG